MVPGAQFFSFADVTPDDPALGDPCVICCDQEATAQLCHDNGESHMCACADCAWRE